MAELQDVDIDAATIDYVRAGWEVLAPRLTRQRMEADSIDSWLRPELTRGFSVPPKASREHRALADLARTPGLGLVVTNVTQAMYVDSIVSEDGDAKDLWRLWMDNGMAAHQIANHRCMVSYGQSFGLVLPATMNGVESARMRCLSPRRMAVEWDDASTDPYPTMALESLSADKETEQWRLYDRDYVYWLATPAGGGDPVVYRVQWHGTGVTPVVRFANNLDLDGNVIGEVTPFIPTAARINKTSYDRLLAQHFNSWKVRTIAGIDLPEETEDPVADEAALERQKIKLSQEDILMSEDPDTKFGTLDGTSLDTFVSAWRSDIEALAAVSQTPAHALTGQLVNLSAEALAAARAPLTQKVFERQTSATVSYARMLRLAASMSGLNELAGDPMVRVTWQDMEIRSMSQAVDALGKAASMLEIPKLALWGRIPGVERSDVQEWERLADEEADNDPLNNVLRRHSASTAADSGDAGESGQ